MLAKLTLVAAAAVAGVFVLVPAAAGVRHQQQLCFGAAATITGSGAIMGTPGGDVIVGSDGPDQIVGLFDNDRICAGAGDDRVGGGPGDDQIDGGSGNDTIDGGPGSDTILGGEGDDVIRCGPDNDVVDGGPGANTAEASGSEACESVTNASPPQAPSLPAPQAVQATLGAAQAVPRPKGTTRNSKGMFSATVTTTEGGGTVTWRLTFQRLTGPASAAHIHQSQPGETGPIVLHLCAPCKSGTARMSQISHAVRMAILEGNAYVDVHTKRNSRGEIRGQIRKVGS